ncbi:cytochrome-c peroxidase [Tenacibaculum sp. C7A-26P2]|uniref:cytochrome-c peroxidase n=1 Tax=Tenacibaculum sp. C7A-26P2 TaxID=3447504 RepID=UPI003F832D8B
MRPLILLFTLFTLFTLSCSSPSNDIETYTPKKVDLEIPEIFKKKLIAPIIPETNPLTEEGINLGKKLFFDPILSKNNIQSCAGCHNPKNSFSDIQSLSEGVNGIKGDRNAMPLFNLAWNFSERFTWSGSELSIERQVFSPIRNPKEMHGNWTTIIKKLTTHHEYPNLFLKAFNTTKIDSLLVAKALAQFQRTLISANSKFDNFLEGKTNLSDEELKGFQIFTNENKGDCFHCHGGTQNPLWTDNQFRNNGLDSEFSDLGLGSVTGDPSDYGKFRTPSLRNLIFTAPYMHDGRFSSIEEVIDHYSEGLKNSETIDPLMKTVNEGGVHLTNDEKKNLKAFLLTLTDSSFVNNPNYRN